MDVSAKKLLETGAHFGHQVKRWNPKMSPYIYGEKDGVHIFDLIKTKECLETALDVLQKSAGDGKIILLLGTKKQAKDKVREVAREAGVFYVNERWLGGTLTNFTQIKKSLTKLADMKKKKDKGEYKYFTKRERMLIDREIERLERFFGGLQGMDKLPDIMFIVDIKKEALAVREADFKKVATVAIVDSNCDPSAVGYPIPMNDDATAGIEYVLDLAGKAISAGKKKGNKKQETSDKNNSEKVV